MLTVFRSQESKKKIEKKRQIKKLIRTRDTLISGGNEMAEAHDKLLQTSQTIEAYIDALERQDLTAFKKAFDDHYDLPQDYKDQLKEEMESERQRTLNSLKPLKEDAEKLRAHMCVSKYKVTLWATTLKAKVDIVDSAFIQVEKLQALKAAGDEISKEIEKILNQCEQLNNTYSNKIKGNSFIDIPFEPLTPRSK
jgi:ubiquitin C-terminal hydrolase